MEGEILFSHDTDMSRFPVRGMKAWAENLWRSGGGCDHEGLGVVAVYGALGNSVYDGYASTYSEIASKLETLMAKDEVRAILMVVNSPGGQAQGLLELCSYIRECSKAKPIVSYIAGEACSAAYAIASSCGEVWMSSDSLTGCCGCYASLMERSKESLKSMGILSRIFRSSNAPRKNMSPITDEDAGRDFQEQVDHMGSLYMELVASNRGVEKGRAEADFGQGAVVSAEYATENGMVDRIGGLEECANHLMALVKEAGTEGEEMDIRAMSADQQAELFTELVGINPSLVAEHDSKVKEAERGRVSALGALRDGTAEVDAIIDAAVIDGREASEVALDVVSAMKASREKAAGAEGALKALTDATTVVDVPMGSISDNPYLAAADELNGEDDV